MTLDSGYKDRHWTVYHYVLNLDFVSQKRIYQIVKQPLYKHINIGISVTC